MMNLTQAVGLERLRAAAPQPAPKVKSVKEVLLAMKGKVDGEAKDWLASKKFYLVQIPIHTVAIPGTSLNQARTLLAATEAAETASFVVVDVNRRKVGQTATGFAPPVVVLAGHRMARDLRAQGMERMWAWVGELAAARLRIPGIRADHQFGSNELRKKLEEALKGDLGIPTTGVAYSGSYPWIQEVYPLENYFVYEYDGDTFKQTYTADPTEREVELTGDSVEVVQRYVAKSSTKLDSAAFLSSGRNVRADFQNLPHGPSTMRTKKKFRGGEASEMARRVQETSDRKGTSDADSHEWTDDAGRTKIHNITKRVQSQGGPRGPRMPGSNLRVAPKPTSPMPGPAPLSRGGGMRFSGGTLRKLVADCKKSMAAGKFAFKKSMQGKTPPGCEDAVRGLKKAKGVDEPYAVAWWMHEQGKC